MSGRLIVPFFVVGFALFDVPSALLSGVGLGVFVYVPLSTFVFEPVPNMHPGGAAGCCQPPRWYRPSLRTDTSE